MKLPSLCLPLLVGLGVLQADPTPGAQTISRAETAGPAVKTTEPRVASFVVERRADRVVGGAAAMMRSRLAVVGNCVLVRGERGEEVVPVFSAGTAFWDSRARRLEYMGKRYVVGDIVPIGGGHVNAARIPAILRSPLVDVPSDCPTSQFWFTAG